MSYQFQPGFILEKLPELAAGLELTLLVSTIGMAGSVVLGLLIAAGSSERLPVLDGLGRGYV